MTTQDAINELQSVIDLIKQDGKDWLDERDIPILKRAIEALQAQEEQRWIPIEEGKPDNKYDDWVLAQIREKDSGYLWIPKVVEYREQKDDWFEEGIGWIKDNPDDVFEVIAWKPLPEPYKEEDV